MEPAIKILAEHYQRSYEVTYKFWRQRNGVFLVLLALIAASALLIASPSGGHPLLLSALAGYLGVTNCSDVASLQSAFPFQLVDSVLLLGVFYATVNLYHRACAVLRGYDYLGAMEKEIRSMLGLDAGFVSFTREGDFYKNQRLGGRLKTVKYAYALLLGFLLLLFLFERMRYDWYHSSPWLFVFDSLVALATLFYYGVYVEASFRKAKSRGTSAELRNDVHARH